MYHRDQIEIQSQGSLSTRSSSSLPVSAKSDASSEHISKESRSSKLGDDPRKSKSVIAESDMTAADAVAAEVDAAKRTDSGVALEDVVIAVAALAAVVSRVVGVEE